MPTSSKTGRCSKFKLGSVVYTAYKKPAVIRMSPYVPVDEKDETSCYATLLLYVPWPVEGEEGLLRGSENAVEALQEYKVNNCISPQVNQFFEAQQRSDEIMNNHGEAELDLATMNQYESDSEHSAEEYAEESGSEDENFLNMMQLADDGDNDSEGDVTGNNEEEPEIVPRGETEVVSSNEAEVCVQKNRYSVLEKFIEDAHQKMLAQMRKDNTYTSGSSGDGDGESAMYEDGGGEDIFEALDNSERRRIELTERISRFTPDQQKAFLSVKEALVADRSSIDLGSQMVQFITGGAGVGKSEYIKCIIEYVRLHYGRRRGFYGSVLAMAPTGAAAYNIGGMTWQSALGCEMSDQARKGGGGNLMSNERAVKFGEYMRSVKLIILDEVSMVSLQSLHEISQRIIEALSTLEEYREIRSDVKKSPFGGIHIIFCGDLYQLKCVNGASITSVTKKDLDAKAVAGRDLWFTLNRYLSFAVSTRYDGHTGIDLDNFLKGARIGIPEVDYVDQLNARMCITIQEAMQKTHPKALWLASTKKEVMEINNFMYNDLVKKGNFAYDVVAHHTTSREHGTKVFKEKRKQLFKDTEWKMPKKSNITPGVLRLALGSRVKVTENLATQLGLYNGARGTVYKFVFGGNCPRAVLPDGQSAHNWYNREIPIVLVQMDQDLGDLTCVPGVRNVIPITKKSYTKSKYTRTQLPLLPAHASTIHSAQGLTAEFGVVLQPSQGRPFAYGLEYVGCSRAKSMDQLRILKHPLRASHFNFDQTALRKIKKEYDRLESTVGTM